MYKYKYSIVIPHYTTKGTELLERLVNSIPQREDTQVLVVDNSPVPIDNNLFANKSHVELLYSSPKYGAGGARNLGLEKADGNWLLFADADDYYVGGFLDVLDTVLFDELEVLYFNIRADSDDNVRARQFMNEYKSLYDSNKEILKYRFWAPWNKVFSHKFVLENNLKWLKQSSN